MISTLLETLIDALETKKEHILGNAEKQLFIDAKKRFLEALNNFIDYRISIALEQRRKSLSHERIAVADSINSAIKATASTVKSIAALNAAPSPPVNIHDAKDMEKWIQVYTEWYNTKRKAGVTIE